MRKMETDAHKDGICSRFVDKWVSYNYAGRGSRQSSSCQVHPEQGFLDTAESALVASSNSVIAGFFSIARSKCYPLAFDLPDKWSPLSLREKRGLMFKMINVTPVLDFLVTWDPDVGDRFCIYLEYVHPGSINKYVRDHCGAITESVVRNFTLLSGLAYLHSTIHRDIKGANLLVDASGVVKLADFGMAKHISGQAAELSMKGSPYWMAPELIHAVNQKDTNGDFAFAVDIWSLGCTIIEIVNGKPCTME
ncbi:hypothetical protein IFM89_010470 [Coptis chinensis]|uniref:Protein kinase domain-containing protein n=1 Tax=Coptis chinensis TaxID=261450 RepID=A0A835HZR3_9MAGN|nr:hypothetical protein IFM89_010470 [Coptis chinensis]